MKILIRKIEILLTLLCLGFIYVLWIQTQSSGTSIPSAFSTSSQEFSPEDLQNIATYAQETGVDASSLPANVLELAREYQIMKETGGEKVLEAKAKAEAQKMLQSGNVELYHQALEQQGLVPKRTEE